MSVFYTALRRDPIQRDPIYDALDTWTHKEPPVKVLGAGLLWGLIVGFLLVAGTLLSTYGDSNLRTAQTEFAQPPASQFVPPGTAPAR